MSTNEFDDMLAGYEHQRREMLDTHRRVKEIEVTSTSPRREVSVTVDHKGAVTDLSFSGVGYRRLAPQELATLIMQTMAAARAEAVEQTAAALTPLMPPGITAKALLNGEIEVGTMMPEGGLTLPDALRDRLRG